MNAAPLTFSVTMNSTETDTNPTKRLSNAKLRRVSDQQQEEEDAAFELAAAAAEAKEGGRGRSTAPVAPTRTNSPDTPTAKEEEETVLSRRRGRLANKENKPEEATKRDSSPTRTRSRSPAARSRSSGDELERMAAMLRNRNSTGGSSGGRGPPGRSLSPRRAPRKVKSERNLMKKMYEPSHRSLSPCRSCLSSSSSLASIGAGSDHQALRKKKKAIRRNVSFGNKCYEEIPKAEEEEKTNIWYDKSELKGLRKEVKKLAKKAPQDELFAKQQDCYRGLEPYVEQYQKRKSGDYDELTPKQQCNQILLELTEIEQVKNRDSSSSSHHEEADEAPQRKSEDLAKMAKEFLHKFAEQGARTAAQDEAEARAIYLESGIDAEQVSKCFKQQQQQSQAQTAAASQPQELEQITASTAAITLGPRGA